MQRTPDVTAAGTSSTVAGLLSAMRPRQWVKNLLVVAVPLASGRLLEPGIIADTFLALVVMCAASAAVYLTNDILDREADRLHPVKRERAIAAGVVPVPLACVVAGLLAAVAVLLPVGLGSSALSLLVLSYLILQVVYVFWAKHQPVLDLACVAAGFVLRAVAGGVASAIPISTWFLTVTAATALFLGFGKRRHELVLLEGRAAEHRKILDEYSPYFLDQMISVVTASTVVAYCLYTLSPEVANKLHVKHLYLTVPFVLYGIFRYLYLVHQKGQGGNPSRVLLTDPPLITTIALWLLTATIILYR